MKIQRAAPVNELLAKLIFLILPTAVVGYFLIWHGSHFITQIETDVLQLTIYFAAGMGLSALFYAFRFRFLPTVIALIVGLYALSKGVDRLSFGEFDSLVIYYQFSAFAILFTTGWIFGWGFLRLRYWSVVVATLLLGCCIYVVAKNNSDTVEKLLWSFSPVVLYAIYIIFTAEQIYSYKDKSQQFWWFLTRRIMAFSALAALLLTGITYLMRKEISETVDNYGGGGKAGKNSMLKQNKDGTFDLEDYAKLRSQLGRNNELLFCAHIDNYFEGTDIPNPLYLTAFYYTKFDTLTETFEREANLPLSDLFEPDPSSLPLFGTKTDSTVIKNSGSKEYGKEVEIQVYSRKLSPTTYLAPHTGYFVQPITVEKDFRDSFKTAFRAKSYISRLNSAYAVYNAKNPQIEAFQKERFKVMRNYGDYSKEDAKFMAYYTYMPSDAKFKNISNLAQQVAGKATTPVDKVIAIRDYFLSKDPSGAALFKYTDNPGVPDIPDASKLQYFLFQNRKGYCAYFAGATLFMLRSLGVPSRIAVGFMTVDRSDKNKGWYWYYADQAHAWVQVYFPGLGWLDFDTTVGNEEAEQSPKPDGTPPMQPPHAYLAADGTVVNVDTIKQLLKMQVTHFVFKDKEYKLPQPVTEDMDVHVATIRKDSVDIPLSSVAKGDAITAVSYAEEFRKLPAKPQEDAASLLKRFPKPEPIDEVYVKHTSVKQKTEVPKAPPVEKPVSLKKILLGSAIIILGLVALFFLWPWLLLVYYKTRTRRADAAGKKAYWTYRTAAYYLHQTGIPRGRLTPMQYARERVDPLFGTSFVSFMNIYLKQKYAKQSLNESEQQQVSQFLPGFLETVKKKTTAAHRFRSFLNPLRSISFFVRGSDNDDKN